MTAYLLLAVFAMSDEVGSVSPADSISVQRVVAAWREREQRTAPADLSWRVVRDSRRFGFQMQESNREELRRLRFSKTHCRLDGERQFFNLTSGRPFPPDGVSWSDLEFSRALRTGFTGTQPSAAWRHVSVVLEPGQAWPEGVSELDRLLAAVPLFVLLPFSNPLLSVEPDQLTLSPRIIVSSAEKPVALERVFSRGRRQELWVDPDQRYRPIRIVEFASNRTNWQIDLEYTSDALDVPARWTVQQPAWDGGLGTFAVAERISLRRNLILNSCIFSGKNAYHRQGARSERSRFDLRRFIRGFLDRPWLSTAVAAGLVGAGFLARRVISPGQSVG